MTTILRGTQPVVFLPGGELIGYRRGSFISLFASGEKRRKIKMPFSLKEHVVGRIRLLNRFFRLGVRCAVPVSDTVFIAYLRNRLYEVDFGSGDVSCCPFFSGVRPLGFARTEGMLSFTDNICFGGYLSNAGKGEVSIYRRIGANSWETAYTFGKGQINHIHALVPDRANDCVWILTGDFDDAAGIWKATDNFRSVERIMTGKQTYRSCVAFPVKEGLLYATDSQLERNSIRLLSFENGQYVSTHLCDTNGSCIYGTMVGDTYYFATSIEGIGIYKHFWQFLTDRKKGPGIKDYNMYIYAGTVAKGFNIIYSQPKDWWPFSFQFGAFQFPSGINNWNKLVFRQVATKKNDLTTMIY